MKLRQWIPIDSLDFKLLCSNQSNGVMKILEEQPDQIDWSNLSMNPNNEVVDYLFANTSKIDWDTIAFNNNLRIPRLLQRNKSKLNIGGLCKLSKIIKIKTNFKVCYKCLSGNPSPSIINYLIFNSPLICWSYLSSNPGDTAIDYLAQHYQNIDWYQICYNTNPKILDILNNNFDKVKWDILCQNDCDFMLVWISQHLDKLTNNGWGYLSQNENNIAVDIIEKNQGFIVHTNLSRNTNPRALKLLKIEQLTDYFWLSSNPSAMDIIKSEFDNGIDYFELTSNTSAVPFLYNHQNIINWSELSRNPGIFVKNYWLILKCAVRLLHIHKLAVISANHPYRKLFRGEFDE